jgi:hypothetical protein
MSIQKEWGGGRPWPPSFAGSDDAYYFASTNTVPQPVGVTFCGDPQLRPPALLVPQIVPFGSIRIVPSGPWLA